MSFLSNIMRSRAEAVAVSAERPLVDLKPALITAAVMCVFFVGLRGYEQAFGWPTGADAFSGAYQLYWMTVLYIAVAAELLVFLGLISYLWTTRDLDVANVEPREETRRTFCLLGWLLLYGIAFYWGASYFSEQDATWHQAAVRDTSFTPVSIARYFIAYPIYIIMGAGGFMYARTRLPVFACHGWSTAYVLLFVGPLMLLPCAAFNAWGSAVWIMEELFVGPLHWGFVFFGWFALAIFGVALLIINRLGELCAGFDDLFGGKAAE
ncbi:MAG TPA: methane monooxygenase/ammonia monooxygenase subunit C [Methylocella sp.]|nr:methane monooxygenase/ammonia monooxygenase subunit C [Methylocella sp.]